jgi:hypothetical protein
MATLSGEIINTNHDVFPLATVWFHVMAVSINRTLNVMSDFVRNHNFDEVIRIMLSDVKLKHKLPLAVITRSTSGSVALEDDIARTLESLVIELFSDQEALFNLFDDLLFDVPLHVTILL